jgi:tetratricopeptide (TPR) repeat protein
MQKLVLTLLLVLVTPNAYAADSGGSAPAPAPAPAATPTPTAKYEVVTPAATPMPSAPTKNLTTDLTAIRSLIASKNFSSALASLKIADRNYPNNADINNLLGYSARNLKQNKAAATYYTKALRINPNHLGALEYQGELFMVTKKISAAKSNLAKLKRLCGVNCEEYLDLKKAIGNK